MPVTPLLTVHTSKFAVFFFKYTQQRTTLLGIEEVLVQRTTCPVCDIHCSSESGAISSIPEYFDGQSNSLCEEQRKWNYA